MARLNQHVVLQSDEALTVPIADTWYDYTGDEAILELNGGNLVKILGNIEAGFASVPSFASAVVVQGSGNTIEIASTASVKGFTAISIFGGGGTENTRISNDGVIAGYTGIANLGRDTTFENAGEVYGFQQAIVTLLSEAAAISNDGLIEGGAVGIYVYAADSPTSARTTITNNGNIVSDGWAISSRADEAATSGFGNVTLNNTGTISGEAGCFRAARTGADRITNSGTMVGDVLLELGDDIYKATAAGEVRGKIFGGGGNDSIIGGGFLDAVFGGNGNDTLTGGAGSDRLSGGSGNDVIVGGVGLDRIAGEGGDDTMSGSVGRDIFVFGIVSGNDTVTDFENGTDKINIHAFGINPANYETAVKTFFSAVTDGVRLDLGGLGGQPGQVTFIGVTLSDIDVTDFLF